MSEPEAKADDKGKKKGGNKLFLIIGVVVLVLGGGGGYWWFSQSAAAEGEHAEGETDDHDADDHADSDAGHSEAGDEEDEGEAVKKKKKRKKYKQPAAMVELDPFVVNLADPSGSRYVKARISLGVDEAEAAAELGAHAGGDGGGSHGGGGGEEDPAAAAHALTKTRVRAVILEILASYTAEEITSREGKTSLKEEIIEEVSALLHNGEVMEVLVTDLIVQ